MSELRERPSIRDCDKAGLIELTKRLDFTGNHAEVRRRLIFTAGAVGNTKLRDQLGSQELSGYYEGCRAVDPNFVNPYWADKK
jgi:hypothetical protein